MVIDLASLPNSRIKPRAATTQASTNQVACAGLGVQLIKAANSNRTYITIRNTGTADIYYGYVIGVSAATGFLLKANEAVDLESPQAVYVFNGNVGAITVCYDEGQG